MTQLSPHFALEEFSKDGPIDPTCIPILTRLCVEVLEPTREFAESSFQVTSGNRPPAANLAAHGQPNSEHMYTAECAAADFTIPLNSPTMRSVFDWMRNNPTLPFHQLILEHGQVSAVIHVSINSRMPGVRSVLEGATHNAVPYIQIEHVAYQAANNSEAVNKAATGT